MTRSKTKLRVIGEVRINNQRRGMIDLGTDHGVDQAIGHASVSVDPDSGTVNPGDEIEIVAGFLGQQETVMKGDLDADSLELAPNAMSFSVVGFLARADTPLGTPSVDGEALLDDEGQPLPLAQWADLTDGQIIKELLDLSGVPYEVDDIAESGVILGTVEPVKLFPDQSPLDLIRQIDTDYGYRTYDNPDGSVRRIPWDARPPDSPAMLLEEGVNLQLGSRTRSMADMFNQINVTGQQDILTGATASDTLRAPSKVSPSTGNAYIPTPPGYRASSHSSSLLETQEACEAFGARFLGEHNRLQETLDGTLTRGNPQIRPGTGTFVKSRRLRIGADSSWSFNQVRHTLNAQGFQTSFTLKGGYSSEGVSTNVAPEPSFTIFILREHIAGQGDIWVIVADASMSRDPDSAYDLPPETGPTGLDMQGTSFNGIVLYQWTSGLSATPYLKDGGKRAIWKEDSNPRGKTITLKVFDPQLKSAQITKTIVIDDDHPEYVRVLWAAITTKLLLTTDGERTWQEIDIPAIYCAEQAADSYQLAIDTDGKLHKVLLDLSHTIPPTAPTNCVSCSIRWKYPSDAVPGVRGWVGTADGKVYSSDDAGVTWTLRSALPNGKPVVDIQESPYAENDIYAVAGNVMYHSYDGGSWEVLYTHPNATLTGTKMAMGFEMGFAGFAGPEPTTNPAGEESRIRERRRTVVGDWTKGGGAATGFPAGTYQTAISYSAAGGETLVGPSTAITLPSGRAITFAAISPLPTGVYGVNYYISQAAGSGTLRRATSGTGYEAVTVNAAPVASALVPVTNTTLKQLAPPGALAVSATVPPAEADDFPAQPTSIQMGVYEPLLTAVGTAPDGSAHSWWADADADFTFTRGEYPGDQLGVPYDIVRDGFVDGVQYGAAEDGLFKTTSNFVADCFQILDLSGAQSGRKIGQGPLTRNFPQGDLIWVGDASTYYTANNAQAPCIMALTSNGFERRADTHPCFVAGVLGNYKLLSPGNGVLLTWARQGSGSGQDRLIAAGAPNFYKSFDGGFTWEPGEAEYVIDIDISPDGFGILVAGHPYGPGDPATIWRTEDFGGTWTLVHTPWAYPAGQGASPTAVIQHPTNPLRCMVRSGNGYYLSTDGGTTFPAGPGEFGYVIYVASQGSFGEGARGFYDSDGSGRVIRWNATPSPDPAYYSQDNEPYEHGGTPHQLGDGLPYSPIFDKIHGSDGSIYAGRDTIYRFTPGTTQATMVFGLAQQGGLAMRYTAGFVPGDATNGWFRFGNSQSGALKQGAQGTSPPEAQWTDLTEQLTAAFPDERWWCHYEGAVRLRMTD